MRLTPLSLSLFAGLALSCFGQTFGEITGVVTDSSAAVVAGATVSVTNPETSVTRTAVTNGAGNYSFPSLLPGIYNVKADRRSSSQWPQLYPAHRAQPECERKFRE